VVPAVTEGGFVGGVVGSGADVWPCADPLNNRVRAKMEVQAWNIRDRLFMVLLIPCSWLLNFPDRRFLFP